MTTIRQSNQVSVMPRLPTLPTLVEPPRPGSIGDALKDVFADSHSNYKGQLRGMDDKALACEGKRLQQVIRDASSGGDKNPGAVARAKAQYAEYKEEKCCRDDIAKGPDAAWAKKAHCMNDSQLGSERCRQLERYHEATTGYDRDPAKAADAKSKLSRLDKESFGRVMDRFQGDLPKATVTRPTGLMEHVGDMMRYQQMSPSQLASEKGQLNATLRDACSGAHRDVQLAANCRQKLELISHCEKPQTRPICNEDLKKYQDDQRHCSTGELRQHRDDCRKQEHDCHSRGDLVGEGNARRKGEVCDGAIVRHQGELNDCRQRVSGMSDSQLGDYASKCDRDLQDPKNEKRRGELCEYQQICRHEQHQRLCDQHFPGTEPTPSPQQPDDDRSIGDILRDLLEGAQSYGDATTGVEHSPADAKDALRDIERDLQQLLEQLTQLLQTVDLQANTKP